MSDWTLNGVARMTEMLSPEALTAFFQVVMIDLVLAGDNAVVIGLAAAGLHESQRNKAILVGIFAATILRIGFASITVQLLEIIGLLLAGGLLLLWVCWKMWRELRTSRGHHQAKEGLNYQVNAGCNGGAPRKTFGHAIWQITIADVSMSLDNVLAVAGAAREHPLILIFGLGLSIALMGLAASFIARLLQKHRWIAYVGLLIILYVAFDMCYRGTQEVWQDVNVYWPGFNV
jgi:YjbE family integral membrane protein